MALQPRRKGDTWDGLEISIDNSDYDFTNCTAKMQFKKDKKDGIVAFEYSTQDATLVRTDNKFKMQPRLMTYATGLYYFDLQVTFADGRVKTFVDERLNIVQDVTN